MVALSGTLLNAATVLVGGLLGTALGDRLPERIRERVVFGVGLFILAIGMKFAIDSSNLCICWAASSWVASSAPLPGSTAD